MKYNYRNKKGRYTKRAPFHVKAAIWLCIIFAAYLAGAASQVEVEAEITHEAFVEQIREKNKHDTPPRIPQMRDVCGLEVVICPEEEPVQNAVRAIEEALDKDVTKETEKRVAYLYAQSIAHNIPFEDAVKTIYCESMWYSQQSNVWDENGQEPSYGLAQIHLPSHPHITKKMALDAYFAIDFLVEYWNTEQAKADNMWYGYSRATGRCTNELTIELW